MPLLMCPNCHAGMKEISREGVAFDMCPECHGVWLDRGELQKLLDLTQKDEPAAPQQAAPVPPQAQPPAAPYAAPAQGYPMPPGQSPPPYPPQPGWRHKHDDSDDDYYQHGKYYGKPYRKKSAMARIFDIFD